MECNLHKLNISVISGSQNTYSIFTTKTPKTLIDGSISAIYNVLSGLCYGSTIFVITPYSSYQNNGIYSMVNGFLKGTLVGSLFILTGIFVGSFQLIRSIINTPFSIYSILNGKSWDNYNDEWIYYNLKKDARLSDLIISVRADEMHHADVNHSYADNLNQRVSKKNSDKKAA